VNGTQLDDPSIIDNVVEAFRYFWCTSGRQCLQAVDDAIAAQADRAERIPEFVRLLKSVTLTIEWLKHLPAYR
jgi:hypothetical protein